METQNSIVWNGPGTYRLVAGLFTRISTVTYWHTNSALVFYLKSRGLEEDNTDRVFYKRPDDMTVMSAGFFQWPAHRLYDIGKMRKDGVDWKHIMVFAPNIEIARTIASRDFKVESDRVTKGPRLKEDEQQSLLIEQMPFTDTQRLYYVLGASGNWRFLNLSKE